MPAIDIFLLCISDGLEYRDLLGMCTRYQSHLRDTAAVVAVEQVSPHFTTVYAVPDQCWCFN